MILVDLKPRRRILVKGPPIGRTKSIGEVFVDLRRSSRLSNFRFVKYDTLDNFDRTKNKEAMVDTIANHKLAPHEIEKKIPKYLYDRLERR